MDIKPVILQGRWVRLEPLAEAHIPELAIAGRDEAIWEFMRYGLITTEAGTQTSGSMANAATSTSRISAGAFLPFTRAANPLNLRPDQIAIRTARAGPPQTENGGHPMAKSASTSKKVASSAAKVLNSKSSTKAERTVAASALTQRGSTERTSSKVASSASKILTSKTASKAAKSAAASALTQKKK